ncbi:MAG: relaxase/mobilization nuclease domain-containing protein, partial [Gemmatimonadaceae bacterium]
SAAVQVPVYHLTISFDHHDEVTPDQMQAIAEKVLQDLGLAEYQTLMVSHRDRSHAHLHVMVNRIHPETGVAWERWQDRPIIERALREQERAFGLREVPGRLHQIDGRVARDDRALTAPRQSERDDNGAFRDRVRGLLPEARATRSWEELEARLAAHGLRVEGKGQGLVVTDGVHEVKASRVARDLSLRRLEDRFGAPYPHREQLTESRATKEAGLSDAVVKVAATARECERVEALTRHAFHVEQDLSSLGAERMGFAHSSESIVRGRAAFDQGLVYVYRDPEAARQLIRGAADTLGAVRVEALIREDPGRFGALRTVPQAHALGLLTIDDDAAARSSALGAASLWRQLAARETEASTSAEAYVRATEERLSAAFAEVYRSPAAARAAFELAVANAGPEGAIRILTQTPNSLGALLAPGTPIPVAHLEWQALGERARQAIDARLVTTTDLARAHTEHAITRLGSRRRDLTAAIDAAPSRDLLRHALRRAAYQLEPRELTELRRVLTSPQAAIVFKARAALREMVLGHDERER